LTFQALSYFDNNINNLWKFNQAMQDKKIIKLFDQNVEIVIEGLASMSGRPFTEILQLLKDRKTIVGL